VSSISIHYRRLPDRERVFEQTVVAEERDGCVVTLLESADLSGPVRVDGHAVLEPGAPVVWFTYPDRWHDIGRFHLADGTFTGVYANILTPVEMGEGRWDTTDLFLDVWKGVAGEVRLLDEDEFDEAVNAGWMDEEMERLARAEAERLTAAARAGTWPPGEVDRWTLDRVMSYLEAGR